MSFLWLKKYSNLLSWLDGFGIVVCASGTVVLMIYSEKNDDPLGAYGH